MKKIILAPIVMTLSLPAMALSPMPGPGFNAHINLGVNGGEMESNFLAEIDGVNVDLSDDNIDSFDSPDSESLVMPLANYDIGYTLASGKTRFSFGNDLTDLTDFDSTSRLSARHDFDTLGAMRFDLLAPPALGTKVYADPYQTNVNRKTTDMETSGARFTWDRIWGSGFELMASAKNVDIDDEFSGEALGLSSADRRLLDREGDVYRYQLAYSWQMNDSHTFKPSIAYIDRDLDGDAMSQDGVEIGLRHDYKGHNLLWTTGLSYADLDGDEENPLFNDTNDAEQWAFASRVSFPGSIKFLGKWVPNVGVTWADRDSDIDFNDSNIWLVSAALARRF